MHRTNDGRPGFSSFPSTPLLHEWVFHTVVLLVSPTLLLPRVPTREGQCHEPPEELQFPAGPLPRRPVPSPASSHVTRPAVTHGTTTPRLLAPPRRSELLLHGRLPLVVLPQSPTGVWSVGLFGPPVSAVIFFVRLLGPISLSGVSGPFPVLVPLDA